MRKGICICLIVILAVSFNVNLYAKKAVLVDFHMLKANGDGQNIKSFDQLEYNRHLKENTMHMPTVVDYAAIASEVGSSFTEEDLKKIKVSLACDDWDVALNSSAAYPINTGYSYCKEWHTKSQIKDTTGNTIDISALKPTENLAQSFQTEKGPVNGYYNILGIRVMFHDLPFNAWALITPPFEIPAYENKTTDDNGNPIDIKNIMANEPDKFAKEYYGKKFENGYGVIKNVGTIKSIELRVFGCQFKNSISILLKDDNNVINEYQFPQYLDFDGWRRLIWNNPNYINRPENRQLYIVPLYPRNMPFIKLHGFRIYRQGDQLGGNFVTYIKDVIVTYDEAILEKDDETVDHESAWGILEQRTKEAKQRELKKIGNKQMLRYLEGLKMHKDVESSETKTTTK